MTMLRDRKLTFVLLLVAAIGVASAQKDGRPEASPGAAPPLAKDGVPATVTISAGSFVMGADAAPLPDAVTQGFGVMSRRPDHGDFDEVPAHPVHISTRLQDRHHRSQPRRVPPLRSHLRPQPSHARLRLRHQLATSHGLLRVAHKEDRQTLAPAHRSRVGVRRPRRRHQTLRQLRRDAQSRHPQRIRRRRTWA